MICPTCKEHISKGEFCSNSIHFTGRHQYIIDAVNAEVEFKLKAYEEPKEESKTKKVKFDK